MQINYHNPNMLPKFPKLHTMKKYGLEEECFFRLNKKEKIEVMRFLKFAQLLTPHIYGKCSNEICSDYILIWGKNNNYISIVIDGTGKWLKRGCYLSYNYDWVNGKHYSSADFPRLSKKVFSFFYSFNLNTIIETNPYIVS